MTRHAYKRIFIVRDAATGIPLHEQEPMTMQQAVERYDREVEYMVEHFKISRKDAEKAWEIYDIEKEVIVL